MKLLVLPRYAVDGASSRVRIYQHLDYLSKSGFDITVSNFFYKDYISHYNSKSHFRKILNLCTSYIKRLRVLKAANKYERVWLEYEFFPYFPVWLERMLVGKALLSKTIVEFDDAVWYKYSKLGSLMTRRLIGDKQLIYIKLFRGSICGNDFLARQLEMFGQTSTIVVPSLYTSVMKSRRTPIVRENWRGRNDDNGFMIGWIGSPSSLKYLTNLIPVFRGLINKGFNVKLMLCGSQGQASPDLLSAIPLTQIDWSEDAEKSLLSCVHCGIMPLDESEWELGKCSYKIVQYTSAGLPVLFTPYGENKVFERKGLRMLPCRTTGDWMECFISLYTSYESYEFASRISLDFYVNHLSLHQNRLLLRDFLGG